MCWSNWNWCGGASLGGRLQRDHTKGEKLKWLVPTDWPVPVDWVSWGCLGAQSMKERERETFWGYQRSVSAGEDDTQSTSAPSVHCGGPFVVRELSFIRMCLPMPLIKWLNGWKSFITLLPPNNRTNIAPIIQRVLIKTCHQWDDTVCHSVGLTNKMLVGFDCFQAGPICLASQWTTKLLLPSAAFVALKTLAGCRHTVSYQQEPN